MDIVLPYQHSDANELRYALRSICLYQPHDNLFLVGDLPDWYTGSHIPANDTPGRPEFSVVNKILIAMDKMTDNFILWQDDIYKLNHDPIKPVYCDTLKNALLKRHEGRIKGILANTAATFPDGYYYGGHTPMAINGKKLVEAIEKHWTKDLIPKTLYGNYAGICGEHVPDCKIRGANDYQIIKRHLVGKDYFSTGHFSINRDMLSVLNELYPEKCKYES